MEDIELELRRHGYPEETHFTIAYSPVPDESVPDGIGGVLATVHEITGNVIGERRVAILRDLGTRAMEAGSFYASTGVLLSDLQRDARHIGLRMVPDAGATYHTRFIGTRRNSSAIGEVLAEVEGDVASYVFRGDELYVRATVTSSRVQIDPISRAELGRQTAWIQPVFR